MESTTWIVFAPGWRLIATLTAGWPFQVPKFLLFSTSSITLATSANRTGAPSR